MKLKTLHQKDRYDIIDETPQILVGAAEKMLQFANEYRDKERELSAFLRYWKITGKIDTEICDKLESQAMNLLEERKTLLYEGKIN